MSGGPGAPARKKARILMGVLAFLAILFGVTSTGWMLGMIHQWLIPWSSLAVLGHPPPKWESPPAPPGH